MYLTGFGLQEQVSKQIAILFKDAPDLRAGLRDFIPALRSQHLMDGPGHTSERHRRKLDAVANSITHSSLPQKPKRKAAEKGRESEKEAAKSAPPTKVCEWYPLTNYPYLLTPYRKRSTPPLRTSHLCHTILNMLSQAHPRFALISHIRSHTGEKGSDFITKFITNFSFAPPSPPQIKSVFDYQAFDSAPHISSLHTSNASYYSPYSQHSRLFFSGDDVQFQDFPTPINEYEPLDYDVPNQPACLLMFTNHSDYMSPPFSLHNIFTLSPFDHSSPFSNASGADENNNTHLRRPKSSSVALNYPFPALPSSPQPTFDPLPRLSVNFGNMSVRGVTFFPEFPLISSPNFLCLFLNLNPLHDCFWSYY
jgi:hypothetical protein